MTSSLDVAVVGGGISGLSAAWLLSRRHRVTLYERAPYAGGHSNTVDVPTPEGPVPVDTGFIVYNVESYPNLVALFRHLDVPTAPTRMGFSVSLDDGRYEYSGDGLLGVFGQPSNIASPAHWRMLRDLLRFFREAAALARAGASDLDKTLAEFLTENGYSTAFAENHILPMAAAIWSTPSADVMRFPMQAFVRFFANHGLLQVANRPQWRTVRGGSREYVRRLRADMEARIVTGRPVTAIRRRADGVEVRDAHGHRLFDACVMATHADEALALLQDPDADERRLLGAFRYQSNRAVLHRDPRLMPRRRRLWTSWNYLGAGSGLDRQLAVSYWMNELQPLGGAAGDLFVTLNPSRDVAPEHVVASFDYAHPVFDSGAMRAQREIGVLQGRRQTWFAGSYMGYGFHEDGLQAGLWAAEDIGGVRRPWRVADESSRIHPPLGPHRSRTPLMEAAE